MAFLRKSAAILICAALGIYLLPGDTSKFFALIPLIASIVFAFMKSLIYGVIAIVIVGWLLQDRFFPFDAVKTETE